MFVLSCMRNIRSMKFSVKFNLTRLIKFVNVLKCSYNSNAFYRTDFEFELKSFQIMVVIFD
jgi:hypothetical protein